MVLASALFFLAFVYMVTLGAYLRGWKKLPNFSLPADYTPSLLVSVIVPVRNEANHILPCLKSIVTGSFALEQLELLVVDDFSEDGTVELVNQFIQGVSAKKTAMRGIKLLQLSDMLPAGSRLAANKKIGLALAVEQCSGELVVTTDGDCLAPQNWLKHLAYQFESNAQLKIVTGPVGIHLETNLLQRFQSLDTLGMMGVTGGGMQLGWHSMGNGANLAYRKQAFQAVQGYAGNDRLASGDDMFLIQKMAAQWSGSVGFVKSLEAVVLTEAKDNWQGFWHQRLRWGTKNAALPEWRIRLILLNTWLFCNGILVGAVAVFAGWASWPVLLAPVLIKLFSDWFFLRILCQYFQRGDLLRWFLPSFFIHTCYIAFAGWGSLASSKYEWKGRKVA